MPSNEPANAKVPSDVTSAYNALIAAVQLHNIRLAAASVSAPVPYIMRADDQLSARISTRANYLNHEGGFLVNALLEFEGHYPDEDAPRVSVSLDMEVVFESPIAMTDELFRVFEQRNLPINTWPFFREFVQSSLARTGWPVFTLPAFKVAPPKE